VAELVDARDLKSLDGNVVWVRVPPPAPRASPRAAASIAQLEHLEKLCAMDACNLGDACTPSALRVDDASFQQIGDVEAQAQGDRGRDGGKLRIRAGLGQDASHCRTLPFGSLIADHGPACYQ
jgi:hypothetical protein